MKRNLFFCAGFVFAGLSLNAHATPGEYWEISAQMDMPGMPMAMPAQKSKVCLPKGGESDPNRTQGKDSNCTFTDVQRSGNTVKFKGSCVNSHGDKMNVSGETTHDANSFKTKMQMSSEGRGGQMTMNTSGKRVGGSCDSEEMAKKAQAQGGQANQQIALTKMDMQAQACDTSKSDKLLLAAGYYAGANPLCTNKKEYCQAVRNKVQHDVNAYQQLADQEEMGRQYAAKGAKKADEVSIVRICSLDMAGLKSTVCKNSVHSGPQEFMDKNCGAAEAKEYREYARAQLQKNKPAETAMTGDCARDYTSQDQVEACRNLAKCGSDICPEDTPRKDSGKAKTNTVDSSKSKTADSVLDGAKKLKGLLSF